MDVIGCREDDTGMRQYFGVEGKHHPPDVIFPGVLSLRVRKEAGVDPRNAHRDVPDPDRILPRLDIALKDVFEVVILIEEATRLQATRCKSADQSTVRREVQYFRDRPPLHFLEDL